MENNTTSVTTHFKKLTTGNNVFIVSVIVQSNCHILQVLHRGGPKTWHNLLYALHLWVSATTAEELVDDADERLFSKVRYCAHHVLDELLPLTSDSQHNLRKRRHNLTLPQKKGSTC